MKITELRTFLEDNHRDFLRIAAQVSPDKANHKADPDKWSIVEIIDILES